MAGMPGWMELLPRSGRIAISSLQSPFRAACTGSSCGMPHLASDATCSSHSWHCWFAPCSSVARLFAYSNRLLEFPDPRPDLLEQPAVHRDDICDQSHHPCHETHDETRGRQDQRLDVPHTGSREHEVEEAEAEDETDCENGSPEQEEEAQWLVGNEDPDDGEDGSTNVTGNALHKP